MCPWTIWLLINKELVIVIVVVIVIVNSRFLKSYLKAKRSRAPAYSRALRRIKGFSKWWSREAQVQFLEGQEGDRVAVKVGVVQMGGVNDQMGQGRSV